MSMHRNLESDVELIAVFIEKLTAEKADCLPMYWGDIHHNTHPKRDLNKARLRDFIRNELPGQPGYQ